MDVRPWQEAGVIMGSLIAGATVLGASWKYALKPLVNSWRDGRNFKAEARSAFAELRTNGGSSLKDAVLRIDASSQKQEARWLAIVDRDSQPTYECAPTGECTQANKAICELFGLSREEMMGNGWLEGVIPSDREKAFDAWNAAVSKNLPYECEYTSRNHRTGETIKVRTTAEPMFDRDERIIGYHGVLDPVPLPDE
jgi:PAS domain S-box-containing protein